MTAETEDWKWPYYPWFPRDFMADTKLLTETEELMYRRLLDYQWLQGSVPSDARDLAAAAGMPLPRARKAWPRIEKHFPMWEDGERRNRRLERERDSLKEKRKKRSEAGKEGADRRWQSRSNAIAEPMASGCQAEAEAEAFTTTATSAAVLGALPMDSHEALDRLCRASGNPDGILDDLARLMAVHPKVIPTGAGMRGENPRIVGDCLIDLANSDRPTWNPRYFRGMVERAKQPVPRGTAKESPGERVLRLAAEQDAAA